MLTQTSLLVSLLKLLDKIPTPPPPKRGPGKPPKYSEKLILKAIVVMIVRGIYTVSGLLAFLKQEDVVVQQLWELLHEDGAFPTRRTWERRLQALPPRLPGLIGSLGRHLVDLLKPWATHGRAAAMDSTALRTAGGVWHKKHRQIGEIPHSSIDTEAGWSKSGYHGWWYGWKLHLAVAVGWIRIPLAAELTVANVGDNDLAPKLIEQLPAEVRYALGDTHYNTPEVREHCTACGIELVATRRGTHPHTDGGVEVRRIFHKLRSQSIEPFNGLFKNVFGWSKNMPVKGLNKSQLFALGAIFSYQLVLLHQHESQLEAGQGVKALLRAA